MTQDQIKVGVRDKIPGYLQKMENQDTEYEEEFQKMKALFLEQTQIQIDKYFVKAIQQFKKHKKSLQKQLNTLQYYSEHPQQNHNLYPLFTLIDEKLIFNSHLIQQSHLKISLPQLTSCQLDDQVLNNKLNILEKFSNQLIEIVKSDSVRKYCKKQAQTGQKIIKYYGGLLNDVKQTIYSSQLKLKKTFEEAVIELPRYKHVQKLTLSMTAPKGILIPANYHVLLNALSNNRSFLTSLTLKIMDMQFSQQKCDILRKRLNLEFKHLKNLMIHNYYKECKLGMFDDFNWHPYRKKINVNSGVWS